MRYKVSALVTSLTLVAASVVLGANQAAAATVATTQPEASSLLVTTLPAEVDEPLTAPSNLRAERNAQGQIELFRWDPSTGGSGPIIYWFHVESEPFLSEEVWVRTTELTVDADLLPFCEGCEYAPDQVAHVWVTAHDDHTMSPPSNVVELQCCPF